MKAQEEVPARPAVTEALVARLWDEQRFLVLPLATVEGEEIQVVYRGRRRWDRGPDFAGALLATPGARLIHGDVEIHLRSSDWRAHGHHRDHHYNTVILHVVLWHDVQSPVLRQDGTAVPTMALAGCLACPLEDLLPAPSDTPLPAPCWAGHPDDPALANLLDRGGLERFRAKVAHFEAGLSCAFPDEVLYRGIAEALGYSQNRRPFQLLTEMLPLATLLSWATQAGERRDWETGSRGDAESRREEDDPLTFENRRPAPSSALGTQHPAPSSVESLLLGAAGLLPSQRGIAGMEEDPYVGHVEQRWDAGGAAWVGAPLRASGWEFFRVRPANFPTRRVAALASLVARWPAGGLAALLASLVATLPPRAVPRAMEDWLLGHRTNGYWASRCDFGQHLRRPADLVGRQRAAEVAVNVFLPLLSAWAAELGDAGLELKTQEIYRLYPKRGDNELSRHVAYQITTHPRPRVARSACRQQGLLHIYRTWCEQRRCGECPCAATIPRVPPIGC